MYENKEQQQTALLAAVDTGEFDVQRSIDELEELAGYLYEKETITGEEFMNILYKAD